MVNALLTSFRKYLRPAKTSDVLPSIPPAPQPDVPVGLRIAGQKDFVSRSDEEFARRELLPLDDIDRGIIAGCIDANPTSALSIPAVRQNITMSRLKRIDERSFRLKSDAGAAIENTVAHNLRGLEVCLDRPDRLLGILPSLQYVRTNLPSLKILVVGPRSECELLYLVSLGFDPANIRGLDLITYSSSVDLGDMHDMPYADASFDIVALSGCIGYSNDYKRVADEVRRVSKPAGIVAILEEYTPKTNVDLAAEGSVLPIVRPRYGSCDDLLRPFEGHVATIPFRHDVANVPHAWAVDFNRTLDLIVVFTLTGDQG